MVLFTHFFLRHGRALKNQIIVNAEDRIDNCQRNTSGIPISSTLTRLKMTKFWFFTNCDRPLRS